MAVITDPDQSSRKEADENRDQKRADADAFPEEDRKQKGECHTHSHQKQKTTKEIRDLILHTAAGLTEYTEPA